MRPVGALDGKGGAGQVAAQDGRGLVDDLQRFSHDGGSFTQTGREMSEFFCVLKEGRKRCDLKQNTNLNTKNSYYDLVTA